MKLNMIALIIIMISAIGCWDDPPETTNPHPNKYPTLYTRDDFVGTWELTNIQTRTKKYLHLVKFGKGHEMHGQLEPGVSNVIIGEIQGDTLTGTIAVGYNVTSFQMKILAKNEGMFDTHKGGETLAAYRATRK